MFGPVSDASRRGVDQPAVDRRDTTCRSATQLVSSLSPKQAVDPPPRRRTGAYAALADDHQHMSGRAVRGHQQLRRQAATWDADPRKGPNAQAVARPSAPPSPSTARRGCSSTAPGRDWSPSSLRRRRSRHDGRHSAGMRDVMLAKVQAGVIADALVWDLDLATGSVPEARFDLIVTVMTLHHIHHLDRALRGFAHLLVEGGHLCVVDLDRRTGPSTAAASTATTDSSAPPSPRSSPTRASPASPSRTVTRSSATVRAIPCSSPPAPVAPQHPGHDDPRDGPQGTARRCRADIAAETSRTGRRRGGPRRRPVA